MRIENCSLSAKAAAQHRKVQAITRKILGRRFQMGKAMGASALADADQAERDHAALKAAVRNGRIDVYRDI